MFEFELKKNANGNVDYIYSVGSGRFGGAEMPYPQAMAICSKANAEGKLSKPAEFIADGFNIKVEDNDNTRYFFGNVVAHMNNKKKPSKDEE